jgi:5-methylcytosine-specific restriction protein A
MATYAITTDAGAALDAQFDVEKSAIVPDSRGGKKGKDAVNSDYSAALRQFLRRLATNKIGINGAWVDSSRVQHLPLSERAIFGADAGSVLPDDCFKSMTNRMQKVGRAASAWNAFVRTAIGSFIACSSWSKPTDRQKGAPQC